MISEKCMQYAVMTNTCTYDKFHYMILVFRTVCLYSSCSCVLCLQLVALAEYHVRQLIGTDWKADSAHPTKDTVMITDNVGAVYKPKVQYTLL